MKKKKKKKAIKNLICHFCKIARLQFYLFLESSYLTIVFLSCNRFINFTFINTRAACLPKWLTVKLRMLPRSLNKSWQYFGFENIIDKNGIRTLDKSKTVCKECRAQISYGTGNTLIGRENTPGGVLLFFSAYVGSDPASTVHLPKKIRNYKHPKKIFEILATQKNIPILYLDLKKRP